jgi:hypothetical protein
LGFIELAFPIPPERVLDEIPDHCEHGTDQLVIRHLVSLRLVNPVL